MTLTDRDRKIAIVLAPLVLVAAFWFLVLAPKRSEATKLDADLTTVEGKRDDAVSRANALEGSRRDYARDYATVVRLGKAIPSTVDMPSLLVQLDEASKGTDIRFGKVTAGTRVEAAPPTPPATSGGSGAAPAAPGGTPAASGPGQAAETAGEGVQTANDRAGATGADATAAATGGTAPGLDSVPLEFEFSGAFFDLADFFHEMKRFVRVANERVRVSGRLMTIDGFDFESTTFPTIKASVKATVYLSPKDQGATAGATPTGPAQTAGSAAPPPAAAPASTATPEVQ